MLHNCFILCCSKLRRNGAHINKSMTICMRKIFHAERTDAEDKQYSQRCCFPHCARAAQPTAGPLEGPARRRTCPHSDLMIRTECSNTEPPISGQEQPGANQSNCFGCKVHLAASDLSVPHACPFRAWPRSYAAPPSQNLHRCSGDDTNL